MTCGPRALFARLARRQAAGGVAVSPLLGGLLSGLGGTVQLRERDPESGRGIVVRTVNKLLQPANLDIVLKNCSWIAIMMVGATILIVAGGIDLSVGAACCLAVACGAGMLAHFGPAGPGADGTRPEIFIGALAWLVLGLASGLMNGHGLRVAGASVHHHAGQDVDLPRNRVRQHGRVGCDRFSPAFGHRPCVPLYTRIIQGAVIIVAVLLDRLTTVFGRRPAAA